MIPGTKIMKYQVVVGDDIGGAQHMVVPRQVGIACPPTHSLYFFGCDSGFSCFGAGICPCSLVGGTMPLILM